MIIKHPIYGRQIIKEPVLIDLINSKPLQRLKNIAQLGVPNQFYYLRGPSRFEHSLGVMILLKKLGASMEEQIAGLLHDVSHLALSHIYDWVIGSNKNEDFQDKIHKKFFDNTDIPEILKKYGFILDRIVNLNNFKLLEREIPNLCADRIDYALIEFYLWANSEAVGPVLKSLKNVNGRIVFSNLKLASIFANTFLKCQREHWGGYEAVARYFLFSLILKDALNKKILNVKDFYQTDDFIIKKLIKSKDKKILRQLRTLKNKNLPRSIKGGEKKTVFKKFRYVDPEVISKGKIRKLSQISDRFRILIKKEKLHNLKGVEVFFDY
jgi:hypothetical protein